MGIYDECNIIEMRTLEECRRYHRILEHALQDSALPSDIHAELVKRFNKVILTEKAMLRALENAEDEKKEVGEGSASGEEGKSGRGSGGGGGTGTVRPKNQIQNDDGDDDDLDNLETIALLFFLSEGDINKPALPTENPEINFAAAAATATLLFNRRDGTAHLGETYAIEKHDIKDVPQMLPALERHATRMGANAMQLRVPSGSVGNFRGYQPVGKASIRKGKAMQKIRKNLPPVQNPPPTD